MLRVGGMVVVALLCGCAMVQPSARRAVEGRCVAYPHQEFVDGVGLRSDTTVVRLGAGRATRRFFEGWRVVEPEIGHDYTYWKLSGPDSVRVAWSNNPMDGTALRLAVRDSGLVGTLTFWSDMVSDDDGKPRPIALPWVQCPDARGGG